MNNPREPKLLDLVAVVIPHDNDSLHPGDVGTVVELLPPDAVEVEFLGDGGRTRSVTTLPTVALLVLNWQHVKVA